MAHLYIDDGHFESDDYANNYIWFDEKEPGCMERMTRLARALASLTPEKKRRMIERMRLTDVRFA